MKTILLTSFLFLSLISITACSDDDPKKITVKTKTELITAKTWTLTKADFVSSDGTVTTAPSVFLSDCSKDNTYNFSTTGTFVYKAGADNCGSKEADAEGTWSLKSSDTVIAIAGKEYGLEDVTDSILKIKVKIDYDLDGDGMVASSEKIDVVFTYVGS